MTDLAKKLREAIDMDAATATDAEWSNLLATAMDVRDALEREPDEAMVERVAKAITLCPVCEGEGTVADGLDEAACSTPCPPCFGTGFDARAAIAAMKGTSDD